MKRRLLPLALTGLFAVIGMSGSALAQSGYPSKPIRFVVPVPAGGAADVMSRMIAEHLQARLGQTVVVENRPGAGSSLGMDVVAKAAPDGYTIGMGNIAANAINPAVRPSAFPYQPVKDFAAISLVGVTPLVLVVHAEKLPVKTLAEFVAHLKANPGKVAYGSSGIGSSLHLGMELLLQKTGTQAIHVPYKGSAPMLNDLLSGQVVASMDAAATSWPHVQKGTLRALGVSTAQRAFFAPDLAPIADALPGFHLPLVLALGDLLVPGQFHDGMHGIGSIARGIHHRAEPARGIQRRAVGLKPLAQAGDQAHAGNDGIALRHRRAAPRARPRGGRPRTALGAGPGWGSPSRGR